MDLVAAATPEKSAKQALRDEMRRRRAALAPGECVAAGAQAGALLARFLDSEDGLPTGTPLPPPRLGHASLFASLPGEVDTASVERVLADRGAALVWPRVDGATLALHRAARSELAPAGRFQIAEPSPAAPAVEPDALDLVIVPGLAFDRGGARLGFGRGFYDRLLAAAPHALRIAICLPSQLVADVPVEAHDQRVDLLLVCGDQQPFVLPTHAARPGGPVVAAQKELH